MTIQSSTTELVKKAKTACLSIAGASTEKKNNLLLAISDRIKKNVDKIQIANAKDVELAKKLVEEGKLSTPLLNRLIMTPDKIQQLSKYLEEVANLDDPVGKRQFGMKLVDGLELERITCPIGLIAIIFESRPEVVVQVTALSLKSGNGVILKGGTEAAHSNRVLFEIIDELLSEFDLTNTVNLIETRDDVAELFNRDEEIDLIIPRGSNEFVKYIQDNTRIPVLGHSSGICHVYVDREYRHEMSLEVILDAKLDYPSACNAIETLLVHKDIAPKLLPDILEELIKQDVKCLGCLETKKIADSSSVKIETANEKDWATEYTDLILSIKVVESLEDAIEHINRYGSHHTDTILTENKSTATTFLNAVDSACVFHNTSTRFSDGYVFGLGAEVGISTNKTHSRGPVGLDGMIIYKYLLRGSGQVRATFSGPNAKAFDHIPF